MNLYEFMAENPVQTFFLGLFLLIVISSLSFTIRFMWKWWMRRLNIKMHGWPPKHLDADGDFRPIQEQDK